MLHWPTTWMHTHQNNYFIGNEHYDPNECRVKKANRIINSRRWERTNTSDNHRLRKLNAQTILHRSAHEGILRKTRCVPSSYRHRHQFVGVWYYTSNIRLELIYIVRLFRMIQITIIERSTYIKLCSNHLFVLLLLRSTLSNGSCSGQIHQLLFNSNLFILFRSFASPLRKNLYLSKFTPNEWGKEFCGACTNMVTTRLNRPQKHDEKCCEQTKAHKSHDMYQLREFYARQVCIESCRKNVYTFDEDDSHLVAQQFPLSHYDNTIVTHTTVCSDGFINETRPNDFDHCVCIWRNHHIKSTIEFGQYSKWAIIEKSLAAALPKRPKQSLRNAFISAID